jgi:transcriptional regulator with XRE-family HTH domain
MFIVNLHRLTPTFVHFMDENKILEFFERTRREKKMSKSAFAKELGMSVQGYGNLLRGEYKMKYESVKRGMDALGHKFGFYINDEKI